jgi:hypothetical protein
MHSKRSMTRVAPALVAGALIFGFAACGGDDDDDGAAGDTTATTATASEGTEATEGTEGGAAGEASVEGFCQAALDAEAAVLSEDPAAIGPAFEAAVAAAPEEVRPVVEEVVANAEAGPCDPTVAAAYAEMIGYVKENCGFNEINVTAADYTYTGLEPEYAAGPAVLTITNEGEEVHELIVVRVNDDVTETATEIVALPEEEAFSMVTFKGAAIAVPGEAAYGLTDLEPGRYIAACFIPQGATADVFAQMLAEGEGPPGEGSAPEGSAPEGSAPEGSAPGGLELGPPHHTQGMIQEFTVT